MENIFKIIMIAVGTIITVGVISYAISIKNSGDQLASKGMNQLNSQLSGLSDADKTIYDGTTLSGTDVIQTIQKYNEDPNVQIIVSTKGATEACNVIYDSQLVQIATDPAGGKDKAFDTYVYGQTVSGWPVADANGNTIATVDATTNKTVLFGGKLSLPLVSTVNGYATGVTDADTTKIFKDKSGYDSTKTSVDPGYISTSASFNSSIQKNQNNEIKFITFVQK